MYDFRWNDWNIGKCWLHNVSPKEAEYIVNHAQPPFPQFKGNEKWLVWGQSENGDYLQVIYLLRSNDKIFVIHARPLTDIEKRRLRRRRR